jgi:hypothetical protein
MMKSFQKRWIFLALHLLLVSVVSAQLPFLHPLFTSQMVLQRDALDPVWGWATPGETVDVLVKDQNGVTIQTRSAVAAGDGRWQVEVGPFGLVAGNAAYSMTVSSPGMTTANLSNILIGDVWLCAGQSNMERTLNEIANAPAEIANAQANYPKIRHFKVSRGVVATTPQPVFANGVTGDSWTTTAAKAKDFTAVGFLMAKEIYDSQQVPIGLLNITWGGTGITAWVPGGKLREIADYTALVDTLPGVGNPGTGTSCAIYNAMVAPATPFRIKGAAWYQGESSTGLGLQKYAAVLAKLREGLRQEFNQVDLPLLIVQLSTDGPAQTVPVETGGFAEIRGAQAYDHAQDPTRTRLVVTIDTGWVKDATVFDADIHPVDKQTVGRRAGQAALNLAYGQPTAYLPPTFSHAVVEGAALRCHFSNVGNGLMVGLKPQGLDQGVAPAPSPVQELPGGTLTGFAVAGANKVYHTATATLGPADTVLVSSPSVPAPLYVRYGWGANPWNTTLPSASGSFGTPLCNLYGRITNGGGAVVDGTAAAPFRNDAVAQLSVNSGSGSGAAYASGQQVIVTASAAPAGQTFAYWSGDSDLLANPASPTTAATLARPFVSIRANYQITAAPGGPTAVAGDRQVSLDWANVSGAYHYLVKRATSPGGPYVTLGLTYGSAFVDAGPLANHTTYHYVYSAVNSVGESPDSPAVAATPVPRVTGLASVSGNARNFISWDAHPGPLLSYTVKRATVTGGPYLPVASGLVAPAFIDEDVVQGVTYHYVVSLTDSFGENPDSAEVVGIPSFVPPPLSAADVGSTGLSGRADFDGSVLTVHASGTRIWNSSDSFHFVSAPVEGDGEWVARVLDGGSGKAGLMVRQALTDDSAFVDLILDSQIKLERRSTAGASATGGNSTGNLAAPYWIKLVRSGDSFSGFASPDGIAWTPVGSAVSVAMSGTVFAGFCVCSENNSLLTTATFDSISGPWIPPAVTGLAATPEVQRIDLGWNAAAGATAYRVERSVDGGPYGVLAPGIVAPAYSDATAPAVGVSSYRVTALNGSWEGPVSLPVSATPLPPPLTPGELAAPPFTWAGGVAELSLAASVPGRTYQLQRSDQLTGGWVTVGPVLNGGGPLVFTDTPPSGEPRLFYRILILP